MIGNSVLEVEPPSIKSLEPERGEFHRERLQFWDDYARRLDKLADWGGAFYRKKLHEIYGFLIPPGRKVLELGCGRGDLLAALKPGEGVGVDWSPEMIRLGRDRHPHLRFVPADAHALFLDETFDVIILSDLINDVWDIQTILEAIRPLTTPATRIILNFHNRLWRGPLSLAGRLGLVRPALRQNWVNSEDVRNLLELTGFESLYTWTEVLWPFPTPIFERFCNRFLAKLWPFRHAALSNFIVARPRTAPQPTKEPLVSVIVPARNEAGNIDEVVRRVPEMGRGTELIFVEGHSRDRTYAAIEAAIARNPDRSIQLLQQTGVGKGDAVRMGFAQATGDVLMILDADLTVPPESLPRFLDALQSGTGEFVNGVRLVYPMQKQAMRFLNLLGNKFFSWTFTWLVGQPIKDTLCGTKVLWSSDYRRISDNRHYFGDFDPFGDFDLLFGAAKLKLKIVDMPVRYASRSYGTTNIQRWRHGWLLLQMAWLAARKLKFF